MWNKSFWFATLALINTTLCFGDAPLKPTANPPVLAIENWQMSNGVNVLFVPEHQLPMIDIEVLFNAGSARDGADWGLANFTNSMIGEGAQDLTADQIAAAFDSLGAQFTTNCGRDSAEIALRTLTDHAVYEKSTRLFTQLITQPNFGVPSFKRVKNQLAQALLAEQQTPSAIADDAFYQRVYGAYPYAHNPLGDLAHLKRLSPNELMAFYRQFYVGNNATLAIVGDIDSHEAHQLAKTLLGDLPAGQPAPTLSKPTMAAPPGSALHIPYPSSQTYIRLGELGIDRHDPNYYALYVGNYILGGGQLVSQLFKTVRDEHGLTYNINSYFIPMQTTGPFITSLQTSNQHTEQAINLTESVLKSFIAKGPNEKELALAKQNIIGSFPLWVASNANIVDLVAMIGFYHLPLDYLDTYRQQMGEVSIADIQRSFAKQLNVNQMTIVTVGAKPHDKS